MKEFVCHAPVFKPLGCLLCTLMSIMLPFVAIAHMVAVIVAIPLLPFFPHIIDRIVCSYKQYVFKVQHCGKGNDDPNIVL